MEDRIIDLIIIIAILVVVYLKIIGIITIPWIWLLSPIWGLIGLGLIFAMMVLIYFFIRRK